MIASNSKERIPVRKFKPRPNFGHLHGHGALKPHACFELHVEKQVRVSRMGAPFAPALGRPELARREGQYNLRFPPRAWWRRPRPTPV